MSTVIYKIPGIGVAPFTTEWGHTAARPDSTEQYTVMPKRASPQRQPRERLYRMSELVAASGVSRDMIKYYLRARLLPKPHKPRPNLSLYTEHHLQLIRLILRLQQQTTLSLTDIASAFRSANYDPATLEIELLAGNFSAGRREHIIPFAPDTHGDINLSVPQDFIDELHRAGLLDNTGAPDVNQMEIAGLLWAARGADVPLSFFVAAREKLRALADLEVKALIAIRRPQLDFDEVVASVTHTDRIINRWIISEKTYQASGMFQRILDNSERALSTIHQAIYLPSNVFRQRFGVDAELARLHDSIAAKRGSKRLLYGLCRACLLLAEFERAIALAEAALASDPDDDHAIACKCLAHGMQGNLELALPYARRLEATDSRHTIALEARLLTLLMQAAKLGGVSDTTDLLKNAVELFRDPLSVPPSDEFDRIEACLLQARASTIFPDAIGASDEAIEALQATLQTLASNTHAQLGLPLEAARAAYQVYTSFYLGRLYEAAGDSARARPCFEQVIQLDPASNFGEMAYLKLG